MDRSNLSEGNCVDLVQLNRDMLNYTAHGVIGKGGKRGNCNWYLGTRRSGLRAVKGIRRRRQMRRRSLWVR
jgi:hypothetical protein